MIDPDIQTQFIERIASECDFVTVEQAWFMKPVELRTDLPACFTYLAEDGPSGDINTISPRQRTTLVYGVWLVCRRDEFQAKRHELREALFGWTPTEHHTPMAYAGGQTSDLQGDIVWWLERWSTDTQLTNRG